MSGLDDARCVLPITFAADTAAILKSMLDPDNAMHAGCRVKKHPGACVLCVLNDDCSKLPMHVNCRCEPEAFLGSVNYFLENL